ncbi:MAG: 50S ribosomal protein L24 [Candidatus Aminicenantes bacterium]|nr:50S ribosomal protein L24 [Candidatus Aminicenantes bacterium]
MTDKPEMKTKLKKNDPVIVIRGRRQDKGKIGKVLRFVPEKGRVVVEKVHVIKEYVRPNPQKNIQGGIVDKEGSIPLSSVQYYCRECERGVRIGYKVSDSGKARVCRKCGTVLD